MSQPVLSEGHTAIAKLKKEVSLTTKFAFGLAAIAILAYIGNFVVRLGAATSDDPAHWGQFGDYIGGILNPLIALLAFYWLTRSVLLQKEEMQRTADALAEAAGHQAAQSKQAKEAAKINALAALLSSADATAALHMSRIQEFEDSIRAARSPRGLDGRSLTTLETREKYRHELSGDLERAAKERGRVMKELHIALLATYPASMLDAASSLHESR